MSSVNSDSDFEDVNNVDKVRLNQGSVEQEENGSTEPLPEGEGISIVFCRSKTMAVTIAIMVEVVMSPVSSEERKGVSA